ncbi:hypothetical protein RND81_04G022800 [Saponaria officinalis]|uniref:Peptidase A1 domain-containing protein n=1 Tax=Saponaria officinalis TaxID=3572 RepID=A0AAW1LGZ8_SAPOF
MPLIDKILVFFCLAIILGLSLISNTDGFTVKMIPIESPHLNFLQNRFNVQERHQFLANISMSRVLSHRKKYRAISPDSIRMTTSRVTHSYFVTQLSLGEGPGASTLYVQLDTTSDVTWLQCQDCNPCFPAANFPYKKSTSFKQLGVHDPMCFPPVFYYQGACGLSLDFDLGKGNLIGIYGQDNFKFLNSTTQQSDVYTGLVFGCAVKNTNIQFGNNGQIIGVFGLGSSPISFTTQLKSVIKGRFSYCLPPLKPTNPTNLDFGDDAGISGDAMTQVKTIAMHVGKQYYLYLTGVSVAGERVPIDTSYFDPGEDFKKGFFIDTGSPYTILAEGVFNPIKDAIAKYFKDKYDWVPISRQQFWELCYHLSYFHEWETPNVILHFWNIDRTEEVDMILDKNHLFQDLSEEYPDLQGFCLMISTTPDPGPSFLGAFQQVNYKFLYDLNNGALSFVPQTCQ